MSIPEMTDELLFTKSGDGIIKTEAEILEANAKFMDEMTDEQKAIWEKNTSMEEKLGELVGELKDERAEQVAEEKIEVMGCEE